MSIDVYIYTSSPVAVLYEILSSALSIFMLIKMQSFGLLVALCLGATFAQSPNKPTAATPNPVDVQKQSPPIQHINQKNDTVPQNQNMAANMQNSILQMLQNTFMPIQSLNSVGLTSTASNTQGNTTPYSDYLPMLSLMLGGDFASQMALYSMMNSPTLASSSKLPFAFANDNPLFRYMVMNSMSQGIEQGLKGQQLNPMTMFGLSSSDLWPLVMAGMQPGAAEQTAAQGTVKENSGNPLLNLMLMRGTGAL